MDGLRPLPGHLRHERDDGVELGVRPLDAVEAGVEQLACRQLAPGDHRRQFDCGRPDQIVHAMTSSGAGSTGAWAEPANSTAMAPDVDSTAATRYAAR